VKRAPAEVDRFPIDFSQPQSDREDQPDRDAPAVHVPRRGCAESFRVFRRVRGKNLTRDIEARAISRTSISGDSEAGADRRNDLGLMREVPRS